MRTACHVSSGRVGSSWPAPTTPSPPKASRRYGRPTRPGSTASAGSAAGRDSCGAVPRVEQRVEQPVVALLAHHLVQRLQRVLVPDGEVGVDAGHAAPGPAAPAGRASAVRRSRARSTSASRAAPSASASQPSSVRRPATPVAVERRRRTCAGRCAAAGSRPASGAPRCRRCRPAARSRTSGSWATIRAMSRWIAAVTTSAAVGRRGSRAVAARPVRRLQRRQRPAPARAWA